MQAVILAGGFGTRISEESAVRPKPMVEIGNKPVLWHIMKMYAHHGIEDFIVCCGYRGEQIKQWFSNYRHNAADILVDLSSGETTVLRSPREQWRVTLVDTGLDTMTGGRIRRVRDLLDDTFLLTYGDGVTDLDIGATVDFHAGHGGAVTLTAVQQPGRFGALALDPASSLVDGFHEKPGSKDGRRMAYISGGFFVCQRSAIDRIEGDATVWEREPLESLAADGQLHAYRHDGFWHPMDTLHDKNVLEGLWAQPDCPWRTWTPA